MFELPELTTIAAQILSTTRFWRRRFVMSPPVAVAATNETCSALPVGTSGSWLRAPLAGRVRRATFAPSARCKRGAGLGGRLGVDGMDSGAAYPRSAG